ncbi:type III secretion system cytoplasmic ring protein SctQ [Diaphorobacter sp. HDW4B]|uniref:type III secretion system cytoplasmic ring protein SctQ n=1 Tax=Diaphorobacter sp. HDW4B TaxID=2714925 RepID=UPI00140C6224|nr:type III secretion system cytoplasmic ring protein SctQ [Diaphorobacter sp. HDW4B]QIL70559.1 type III secretion system cytoplasmic ring protein SctQ [Diaphorobacter sp. HDW4B]
MSALPQQPAIRALPLPRLTRNEAQGRTIIAQRGVDLPLQLGDSTWLARLVPITHASAPQDHDPSAQPSSVIRMEWAGANFTLRLPIAAMEQQVSAQLGGASLPDLPPSLAQAAQEAVLSSVLHALQRLGRGTPSLVSQLTASADKAADPAHAFKLTLRTEQGPQAIEGSLHADGLGLLLVAGLLKDRPFAPASIEPDFPLTLHAELGFTRTTAEEVAQLDKGDVVLMSTCFIAAQRVLWLSADGRAGIHAQLPLADAHAEPTPPSLSIIQTWTAHMPTDTNTSPSSDQGIAQSSAEVVSLESLPVRLSFDLGEVTLTLAQVHALQVGQALTLDHPLQGAVRIRANGALIGEGDLVEVDGHIGVSIARILGSSR